jgi:hypothetical protein
VSAARYAIRAGVRRRFFPSILPVAPREVPLGLALFLLAACKPQGHAPVPTRAETASLPALPAPTATPGASSSISESRSAAAEKSAPAPASAPSTSRNVLYVSRAFSVTDDSGIYGFPVGTRVTLVSDHGDTLTVTDHIRTGSAPRTSFRTAPISPDHPNSPPPAAVVAATPIPASSHASDAARMRIFNLMTEARKKRYLKEQAVGIAKKREFLTKDIADLTARIAAAEKERSGKQSRQTSAHYYYDSWGYAYAYSPTSAYSLSADATNPDALRKKLEIRKQELAALPDPAGSP